MLTIDKVAEAMLGNGLSFKKTYYPELLDCVKEFRDYVGKKAPGGLTIAFIKRNGYSGWKSCFSDAPDLENEFGRIVLDAWIKYFFEEPDIMEFVGIIAEQENPEADPEVIKEMRNLNAGDLVLKSSEKGPLTGMKVVFTGASEYFKGENMERFLEKNGATTSHSVTSKTDLLITGKRPAYSKLSSAKGLGIRIISEEDFVKQFKGSLVGLPK